MKIIKRPFVKLSRMALLLLLCLIPIGFPYNVKANGNSLISDAQYIPGEIVLIFKPEVTEDEKEELITSIAPDATVIDSLDSMSVISVKSLNKYDWYLKHFNLSPLVTSAEPNYIISSMNLTNDTYITSQWAVKNTGSYRSFINSKGSKRSSIAGIDLNLENTWDYYNLHNLAKEKVIVAIIDTGVDIRHKDLSKHIWKNTNEIPFDGIDNDDNGYIDDVNGWDFYNNDHTLYSSIFEKDSLSYSYDPNDNDDHGTHVAGIIGAVANNNIGIAGVASNINIQLMPLKIEGGKNGNGTISNAIKAIKYATKMGAKICNISWGSSVASSALEQAIKESNMLFICAAGNTGTNNDKNPVYPASYQLDNIISVAFINQQGKLCKLSNYGPKSVDLAAPGYDILSTTVGNSYASMSGSSMAVPHVTGIAAMLYAFEPNVYPSNIKKIILSNVLELRDLKSKVNVPGIPNGLSAVTSLYQLRRDTQAPTVKTTTSFYKDQIKLSLNVTDKGGSGVRVLKYVYGKKSIDYFENGTQGTSITNNAISLKKAGLYTIYLSDYANNSRIVVVNVKDDSKAPSIQIKKTKSGTKTKITARVTDSESGVLKVKYKKGTHSTSDFLSSKFGTVLTGKKNTYTFYVSEPGTYTIYATDYRGNKTVSHIKV